MASVTQGAQPASQYSVITWVGGGVWWDRSSRGRGYIYIVVIQWLSHVRLFATPWTSGSSVLHYLPEFIQIHVQGAKVLEFQLQQQSVYSVYIFIIFLLSTLH